MPYRELPPAPPPAEVMVAAYDTPHEAHLAVLHLETLGIPARTLNELVVGMAPHLGGGSGGVQVLVQERDAAEAHAALEKLRREVLLERSKRTRERDPGLRKTEGDRRGRLFLVLVGLSATAWYLLQQLL